MKLVVTKAIVKKRCKRIRLRDNHITSQGALILAEGLHHNILLESLDLRNNRIGDVGVQVLAPAIAQSNLKTLNLESNQITYEGAPFLAQMLRNNRTLTELYLSKNQLGDRGVELLANVLTDERRRRSEQENRGVSALVFDR
jgi:Ran GTPase-activating protein (RanGAP) involved in mRNA processing and transport